MFLGKGVLKICSKFAGEHPCRSAIRHGCSPVNLLHNFRAPFLKNTSRWLLLDIPYHILDLKNLALFLQFSWSKRLRLKVTGNIIHFAGIFCFSKKFYFKKSFTWVYRPFGGLHKTLKETLKKWPLNLHGFQAKPLLKLEILQKLLLLKILFT